MPIGYAQASGAAAVKDNFRIGDNPLTDLANDFFDQSFANTTFAFGFNYVVPPLRRAFIDRVDIIVRVEGPPVIPGGLITVVQNYIASGGPAAAEDVMVFEPGEGPGTSSILGKPFGLLLPGDTLQCFISTLNCGTSGRFISSIRGAEYDV